MPEKIPDQIMDVVAGNVPEDFLYVTLKAPRRLLETRTLSDEEKMDVLFKSESLSGGCLSGCHADLVQLSSRLLSVAAK
jgi:hypothetical protein